MLDQIPLSHLPRELSKIVGAGVPTYRALYARVLNGEIPAEQINGRWHVRREDLETIAERLGVAALHVA